MWLLGNLAKEVPYRAYLGDFDSLAIGRGPCESVSQPFPPSLLFLGQWRRSHVEGGVYSHRVLCSILQSVAVGSKEGCEGAAGMCLVLPVLPSRATSNEVAQYTQILCEQVVTRGVAERP